MAKEQTVDEKAAEAAQATLKKAVGDQWGSDVEKAKGRSRPAEEDAGPGNPDAKPKAKPTAKK